MWKLVEVRNATAPSSQTRREQKAELDKRHVMMKVVATTTEGCFRKRVVWLQCPYISEMLQLQADERRKAKEVR